MSKRRESYGLFDIFKAKPQNKKQDEETNPVGNVSTMILDLKKSGFNIPPEIINLLWIKNGPLKNYSPKINTSTIKTPFGDISISITQTEEPSLLDLSLPIEKKEYPEVQKMGYYPSYAAMLPEQRYTYLNWLQNVSNDIEIGYVFVLYYGLERHLFGEKFEDAFNLIAGLRKHHKNNSFLSYSSGAMLMSVIIHNRPDLIKFISLNEVPLKTYALIVGYYNKHLTAADIVKCHSLFGFTNKRYISNEYDLFVHILEAELIKCFGKPFLPITIEDINKCSKDHILALANISAAPELRFSKLPDISTNSDISKKMYTILLETHEKVKIELKTKRTAK